jgi:hypothetical protein
MRVRINYRDGNYSMEAYTDGHAKAGLAYVEVDESDWREYRDYIETAVGWNRFLVGLDNEQYAKDHPEWTP